MKYSRDHKNGRRNNFSVIVSPPGKNTQPIIDVRGSFRRLEFLGGVDSAGEMFPFWGKTGLAISIASRNSRRIRSNRVAYDYRDLVPWPRRVTIDTRFENSAIRESTDRDGDGDARQSDQA